LAFHEHRSFRLQEELWGKYTSPPSVGTKSPRTLIVTGDFEDMLLIALLGGIFISACRTA
jgi:hypothetical protein